jgi:plastocyanin
MKAAKWGSLVILILFATNAIKFADANTGIYANPQGAVKTAAPATQPTTKATASVTIENFAFIPKELDITVGTTVTWQNVDDVPHTATSKGDVQVFDSGPLDTDDKFSFTFTQPGTYAYYCKVHPHMTGVVIVK